MSHRNCVHFAIRHLVYVCRYVVYICKWGTGYTAKWIGKHKVPRSKCTKWHKYGHTVIVCCSFRRRPLHSTAINTKRAFNCIATLYNNYLLLHGDLLIVKNGLQLRLVISFHILTIYYLCTFKYVPLRFSYNDWHKIAEKWQQPWTFKFERPSAFELKSVSNPRTKVRTDSRAAVLMYVPIYIVRRHRKDRHTRYPPINNKRLTLFSETESK